MAETTPKKHCVLCLFEVASAVINATPDDNNNDGGEPPQMPSPSQEEETYEQFEKFARTYLGFHRKVVEMEPAGKFLRSLCLTACATCLPVLTEASEEFMRLEEVSSRLRTKVQNIGRRMQSTDVEEMFMGEDGPANRKQLKATLAKVGNGKSIKDVDELRKELRRSCESMQSQGAWSGPGGEYPSSALLSNANANVWMKPVPNPLHDFDTPGEFDFKCTNEGFPTENDFSSVEFSSSLDESLFPADLNDFRRPTFTLKQEPPEEDEYMNGSLCPVPGPSFNPNLVGTSMPFMLGTEAFFKQEEDDAFLTKVTNQGLGIDPYPWATLQHVDPSVLKPYHSSATIPQNNSSVRNIFPDEHSLKKPVFHNNSGNEKRKPKESAVKLGNLKVRILEPLTPGKTSRKRCLYVCEDCDESFSAKTGFAAHQKSMHPKSLTCSVCSRTFTRQCDLTKHENYFKKGGATSCDKVKFKTQTRYYCEICNKSYVRQSYLRKHMELHNIQVNASPQEAPFEKVLVQEVALVAISPGEKNLDQAVESLYCRHCKKHIPFQFERERHEQDNCGPFRCKCQERFPTKEKRASHRKDCEKYETYRIATKQARELKRKQRLDDESLAKVNNKFENVLQPCSLSSLLLPTGSAPTLKDTPQGRNKENTSEMEMLCHQNSQNKYKCPVSGCKVKFVSLQSLFKHQIATGHLKNSKLKVIIKSGI